MRQSQLFGLCITVGTALFISACSSTPKPLPQLDEDARNSVGTVGILTVGPAVGGEVDGPVGVGGQVALGVIKGGAIGLTSGVGAGMLAGLVCDPGAWLCVPVGMLVGGTVGLVGGGTYGGISEGRDAIPESAATEIQTALMTAISDHDLQEDLRHRVFLHMDDSTMSVDLGVGATESIAEPDYSSIVHPGVGSVLELSLTEIAFAGEGGSDPALALVITARARLIRITDNNVLWTVEEVSYESEAGAYSLWVAGDSGLLKVEFDNALEGIALQIGDALSGTPETKARVL